MVDNNLCSTGAPVVICNLLVIFVIENMVIDWGSQNCASCLSVHIICKVLLLNFTSPSNWSMLVAVTWVAHDLWFLLQAVVTRGGRFLEAPVIGSKQLAKDGQLVVVVAGDKSLYDDCQSCLQAMARHIFYLGLLLFMLWLCVQSNLPK